MTVIYILASIPVLYVIFYSLVPYEVKRSSRKTIILYGAGVKNKKSMSGKFMLTGFTHLKNSRQSYINKRLNPDDEVVLKPDCRNNHDNQAIKVYHNKKFIGWVSREFEQKPILFSLLMLKKPVESIINYIGKRDGYIDIEISYHVEDPFTL